MRILLDTQIWLWMLSDPDRLSEEGRARLRNASNELVLSAASTWEIAIKAALGRLQLPDAPERVIPEMMLQTRVEPLEISVSHTLRVGQLPRHHRDPFDRLLVAQAQLERLPIMTADAAIVKYEVDCLDP